MKLSQYFFTIIYLKPKQIYYQLLKRCINKKISTQCDVIIKPLRKNLSFLSPVKKDSFSPPHSFCFFTQKADIISNQAWNHPGLPKLWLYQLHYFDYIHQAAQVDAKKIIERWINENPVGYGNGWEPYTLSQRIVNWIKWILQRDLSKEGVEKISHSLYLQARYLANHLEFHLLGNHLFANAKALIFAGCFFQGKEASRWLVQGKKIFFAELLEQIHADGGHFERSPMYHAKMIEDFLDIYQILTAYDLLGNDIVWADYTNKMLRFMAALTHPNGEIAYFNDSINNFYHSLSSLQSYANQMGLCAAHDMQHSQYFPQSGFVRLQNNQIVLLCDIGGIAPSYIPGHAHAETLCFELSYRLNKVFVNTGITTYDDGECRLYERGTAAHNCLVIDKTNSSQVWKSFRVAKRASVIEREIQLSNNTIKITHNGYRKILGDDLLHERKWQLERDKLLIADSITGKGRRHIEIYFHFHPDITVELKTPYLLQINVGNMMVMQMEIDQKLFATMEVGYYAESFGVMKECQVLKLEGQYTMPVQFQQKITWR